MHVIVCAVSVNFGDEIILRGEECKTWVNFNFSENGQIGEFPMQYRL